MESSVEDKILQLRPGEYLFREGDFPQSMFLLKKGKLRVLKRMGPYDVPLNELEPPAVVGEMGFFDRQPRSASVVCIEAATLIELPFDRLKHSYENNTPEWVKTLVKTLLDHIRRTNQKVAQFQANNPQRSFANPLRMKIKMLTLLHMLFTSHEGRLDHWTLNKFISEILGESVSLAEKILQWAKERQWVEVEILSDGLRVYKNLALSDIKAFLNWYFKQNVDILSWAKGQMERLVHLIDVISKTVTVESSINRIEWLLVEQKLPFQPEVALMDAQFLNQVGWLPAIQVDEKGKFFAVEDPQRFLQQMKHQKALLELAIMSLESKAFADGKR